MRPEICSYLEERRIVEIDNEILKETELVWFERSGYLEQPLQAHFPLAQGQFLSSPPQLHVVLSPPPGAGFVSALGQLAQAHSPGEHGHFSESEPHLQVV
jgi:hypothetical protein